MLLSGLIIRRLKRAPWPLSVCDVALGGALCELVLAVGDREVDEGLSLREAVMRYMSKRERGAAVVLAALKQCPLRGFVRSTVIAAFALYLFIGLRNYELIEVAADALGLGEGWLGGCTSQMVAEAELEPSMRPTMIETYLDGRDTRRRGWSMPERLAKKVEWYLGLLEEARIGDCPLVYWYRDASGIKLYTLSLDDAQALYRKYKDSKYPWEREIAEDLARRYPWLAGDVPSTPVEGGGWRGDIASQLAGDAPRPSGDGACELTCELRGTTCELTCELMLQASLSLLERRILEELARSGTLTRRQLAERLGVSERWVAELVRRLKAKGLVEARKGAPGVRLTELGRAVAERLVKGELEAASMPEGLVA